MYFSFSRFDLMIVYCLYTKYCTMNEFIIQWYSRSIFNFQPSEINLRKKIQATHNKNLHQEFINIYIYDLLYFCSKPLPLFIKTNP